MEGSGRAVPSVELDDWRREEDDMMEMKNLTARSSPRLHKRPRSSLVSHLICPQPHHHTNKKILLQRFWMWRESAVSFSVPAAFFRKENLVIISELRSLDDLK